MEKLVLLFFVTVYNLPLSTSVYFTMTNIHMNLSIDSSSFNAGIALGQIYASNGTAGVGTRGSTGELVYSVVNGTGSVDVSEYSGRVFVDKGIFKEKGKDHNHTVAISVSDGSSISITHFTLTLSKRNSKKAVHNRTGLQLPTDCNRVITDLCFWPSVTYRVYENENGTILGSLSPSYFHEACGNYTVHYTMKDTSGTFGLLAPTNEDEPSWRLQVTTPMNRDTMYTEHYQFDQKNRTRVWGDIIDLAVTCCVDSGKGSKRYNVSKLLEINILDRNDNAPMIQYIEDINIYLDDDRVKKGAELHHKKLVFTDRDSHEVNTYDIRILNDTNGLFEPRCKLDPVYHHVSDYTALHCKLVFRNSTQMPASPYTIIIQINDTTVINGLNASHIQVPIHIFSNGEKEDSSSNISSKLLALYPKSNVEVYKSAAPFARLIQPKLIPKGFGNFTIINNTDHNGCLNVTPNTGIVYVHNVALLRIAGRMRLNIQWVNASNLTDHDELTIHVIHEPTPTCTNVTTNFDQDIFQTIEEWDFCSSFKNYNKCVSRTACGLSTGGYSSIEKKLDGGPARCQWRGEKFPGGEMTPQYATCTPDKSTCPDTKCDELEELYHLICPQDCTFEGTLGATRNSNNRGIKLAAGVCTCDEHDKCYCNIPQKSNSVKSDSRTIGNITESAANASIWNRHTDHQHIAPTTSLCGTSCLIALTAATIFILLTLTATILCWKLGYLGVSSKVRRRRRNSKYSSDDVPDLLSAQLSDYVDRSGGAAAAAGAGATGQQMMMLMEQAVLQQQQDGFAHGGVGWMLFGSRLIPPPDPKWEFPRTQLVIEQTLGEGEFGRVLRAKARDIAGHQGCTTVAVKTLKDDAREAELADLMSEYELLKDVCHPNVIRLLGASTVPGGPIYLIMEFAEFGSLRSYIRRTRHLKSESNIPSSDHLNPQPAIPEHYDQPKPIMQQDMLTSKDILSFAWQISKGMAYLTDIKLVHRDLAARNVLVASGKICKISDFGLTRDVYEDDAYFKRSKGRVPVKWMAPESLSDHIYTTKSDIWSFGVLIWELVTLGATPYPGIPVQNLFHVLKNGYRMEKPENCSPAIYRIMRQCWEVDPERRPTFMQLALQWESMLEQDIEYLDLTPDAIHNRSYFCTLLSEDNNELETTILNPAFSPVAQQQNPIVGKILNNDEHLNLDQNEINSPKYGESSKLLHTPELAVKGNNNNTIKSSNTYTNTPSVNNAPNHTSNVTNSLTSDRLTNNIQTAEDSALIVDKKEGYETPVKIRQKSPGNRTPTNEHPQYYTDMTVGSVNGSNGSKQLLLNCNSIGDLIGTN